MSVLLTFFHLFVFVAVISGQNFSTIEPTRYDMIHYLVNERRYDPSLPPDFYIGNSTTVSVELSIYDLNSENDMNMEYESTLYLRMNWTDQRLDFTENKTSYDTLSLGDKSAGKLWLPDLYFHHERKAELHGLFTKNQLVYIHKNGSVLYSGRFNIKAHCKMDLTKYPYDTQKCPIIIQSYSLSKDDLMLQWNGDNAVKIDKEINLKNIVKSQKHTYESPYDNPVGNFSTLSAVVSFQRSKNSLSIMYIAPPVTITVVSMFSFLLGENIGPRITAATGALTPLVMQWAAIYSKLPPVPVLTYFDEWMLGNLIAVGIVLVVNACICHIAYPKKTKEDIGGAKDKNAKRKEVTGGTKDKNAGEVVCTYTSTKMEQMQTDDSNQQIIHEGSSLINKKQQACCSGLKPCICNCLNSNCRSWLKENVLRSINFWAFVLLGAGYAIFALSYVTDWKKPGDS